MRIEIFKDGESRWVKPDRLNRFLELGWQTAQPEPKKVSKPKAVVKASADVVEEDPHRWDAPLLSMPTTDLKED